MSPTTTKLVLLCFPLIFAFLLPCNGHYCRFKENYGGVNEIKGMFVFGSSLVDNGNNNFLQNSLARADYLPYGIDFPYKASGRFTNGNNVIDLLGEKLKLPNAYIPVFSDPSTKGSRIIHGVNYASGGSGIVDETGSVAGQVTTLNQQLRNFENVTLPDLEAQLGCTSRNSLPNYLFVLGTGGNDYSFNYFLSKSNTSLEAFTDNLINSLSQQLQKLYSLGGRKFVLMSINPLGCSPMVKALQPMGQNGCVEVLNQAAELFNTRLKLMVDDMKRQSMPSSIVVFVNSFKIIKDIIKDPASNGFTDTGSTCCEVLSRNEGGNGILCKRGGRVCAERNTHVFFDGLHPTEAVNIQIATKAFASYQKDEVYPINIQQLVKL